MGRGEDMDRVGVSQKRGGDLEEGDSWGKGHLEGNRFGKEDIRKGGDSEGRSHGMGRGDSR